MIKTASFLEQVVLHNFLMFF